MKSFCFILTPLDVNADLPFEIIPGYFLENADQERRKLIKEKLSLFLEPSFIGQHYWPQYEFDWRSPTKEAGNWTQERLNESLWRYWVISFTGANLEIGNLNLAASLVKEDIELGFQFIFEPMGGGTGFSWQPEFLSSFFQSAKMNTKAVPAIGADVLREISYNHEALKMARTNSSNVYQAVHHFHYLKALPRQSSMLVIGYFSIIEALIAHKPRLHESLDSINHQLQSKLILLIKKFQREVDYSQYFGNMGEKQIWKRLYAYRSAIAHDTLVTLDSEFKDLGERTNVLSFLGETVKLLLTFALKEPVFLADLKNC